MNHLRAFALAFMTVATISGGSAAQEEEWEAAHSSAPPAGADMFQLNDLASFKKYSRVKNFEIVGHSYRAVLDQPPGSVTSEWRQDHARSASYALIYAVQSYRLRRADCGCQQSRRT